MKNETKKIRYFSMFTGVGGFELGLERASNLRFIKSDNTERSGECDNIKNEFFKRKQLDSKSFPKIKQDRERWNRTSEEQGALLRIGQKPTLFTPIGFSEIDKYASELLSKRFPDVTNYGDATKIKPEELQDFDMLCGGFPCQSFSIAGKRRGFQDTRGTMFFEIARIVEFKRPKLILLENVKGLLNHNKGETFKVILQTLEELGYRTQWMVLNSKFFGVPQNRERVFIIGSIRGEPRPEILPFREANNETYREPKMIGLLQIEAEKRVNDCPVEINQFLKDNKGELTIREISEKINENLGKVEHYFRTDKSRAIPRPDVWSKLQEVLKFPDTYNKQVSELTRFAVEFEQTRRVYSDDLSPTLNATQPNIHGVMVKGNVNPSGNGMNGNVYSDEGISPTIDTNKGEGKKIINNMKIRRLTPLECERLQGFPEGWTEGFSNNQRYKMMGNAVTVNVIKAIAERLVRD